MRCAKVRAQASFELSVAIVGMLFLLLVTARVMVWYTNRLLTRQEYYDKTRVAAGQAKWSDYITSNGKFKKGRMYSDPALKKSEDPCDFRGYHNKLRIFDWREEPYVKENCPELAGE